MVRRWSVPGRAPSRKGYSVSISPNYRLVLDSSRLESSMIDPRELPPRLSHRVWPPRRQKLPPPTRAPSRLSGDWGA